MDAGRIPFKSSGTSFWSETFALKLMWNRGGKQIGLPELYGGFYIGNYEKCLIYFQHWDQLRAVMAGDCGVSDPIWFYWCEMYEIFKKQDSNPFLEVFVTYDNDAYRLLKRAGEVSTKTDSHGTKIVGLEQILLATFDFEPIPLCRALLGCGLQKSDLTI